MPPATGRIRHRAALTAPVIGAAPWQGFGGGRWQGILGRGSVAGGSVGAGRLASAAMAPVTKRQRYLEAVVETMVADGRVDQTLDAFAEAAGTSDRMLLYYFETRDALVAEAIRLLRARRRQVANTVMTRISLAPTAIEGIRDGLVWLTEPEQIAITRLLRTTTARALRGEELFEAFVDDTISDWIEEATLTGRRLGADAETATVFATLLVALGDALAVDRYATTDLERIEASILSAASLLAGLVGAPTTFPEPEAGAEVAAGAEAEPGADSGTAPGGDRGADARGGEGDGDPGR